MGEPQGVQIFPGMVREKRKQEESMGLVEGQTRDQILALQLPSHAVGQDMGCFELSTPFCLDWRMIAAAVEGHLMTEDYVEHGAGAQGSVIQERQGCN